MAEYIEREAAIKLIAEDKVEITPLLCAITQTYTAEQAFDGLNQSCDRHIKFINSIPSADVQPVVHGRWNAIHERGLFSHPDSITYVCSECGKQYYTLYNMSPLSNYCPDCGARMDGEP